MIRRAGDDALTLPLSHNLFFRMVSLFPAK